MIVFVYLYYFGYYQTILNSLWKNVEKRCVFWKYDIVGIVFIKKVFELMNK